MKQKPFSIHFVCRGNTYRSRLAAAYMATLLDDRYVVSSSGVGTHRAKIKTSERYTKAIAKQHNLTHGITTPKTQTTDEVFAAADIIVFMKKDVYDEALRKYTFDARKATIWRVADLTAADRAEYDSTKDVEVVRDIAEAAFQKIRRQCDELHGYITRGSWVDVFDKEDQPAGIRLPINWVGDRGLWHRGIRVVVRTADGKYVVGKRSSTMVYGPGMLEVGVGGLIDSGELPRRAAARETHEELGIRAPAQEFRPLFKYRVTSYHPHYRTRTRVHIYTYTVTLPVHSSDFHPQEEEVAASYLLSPRQTKHLLRTHRLQHYGRLTWDYKLFRQAVAMSQLPS